MLPSWYIDQAVRRALAEDVGKGDLTTNALVPENLRAEGLIYSKAHGILAGMPVASSGRKALPEQRYRLPPDFCRMLPSTRNQLLNHGKSSTPIF
jgi:nicotinate-nucleotide pyrophosphorylase